MPKIHIIYTRLYTDLETEVNQWINDNFGSISQVYDVSVMQTNDDHSWVAIISYEQSEGK